MDMFALSDEWQVFNVRVLVKFVKLFTTNDLGNCLAGYVYVKIAGKISLSGQEVIVIDCKKAYWIVSILEAS